MSATNNPWSEQLASLEKQIAALELKVRERESEFAIISRAVGNWREWPEKMSYEAEDVPDWVHDDWKAAARAILERDGLAARVRELEGALRFMAPAWHQKAHGSSMGINFEDCDWEHCKQTRAALANPAAPPKERP